MAVSKWFKRGGTLAAVTVFALSFASCGAIDSLLGLEDGPVSVSGVNLNYSTRTIPAGGSVSLIASVSPSNAENQNVTWSSSNESVATVSSGVVNGIANGTATITVTSQDGAHTADCVVTVADIEIAGTWDGGMSNYLIITNTTFTVDNPDDWYWDYSGEVISYSNDGFNAGESGLGDSGYAVIKFTSHPSGSSVEGKYTVLRWQNLATGSVDTTVQTCEGYGVYFETAEAAEAGATFADGYFTSYSSSTKQ